MTPPTSDYLRQPDLFPARFAGEPWGERATRLDLPGGPYRLEGLTDGQVDALEARYGEPDPSIELPDQVVPVFRAADEDFNPPDRATSSFALDLDYRADAVAVAGRGLMGLIRWRPETVGAIWTRFEAEESLPAHFENFLRVLVAYRLLDRGGLLLHSSGVANSATADLFFGASGAGKTTVARMGLDVGLTILSDDINAVEAASDGGYTVRRIPFAGELGPQLGETEPRTLRALYHLRQADGHGVSDLTPAAASAALIASTPFLNRDPYRLDLLVSNVERLATTRRVRRLDFSRDPGLWDILPSE